MRIQLPYGRQGLAVDLPDDAQIIRGQPVAGVADEAAALRHGLRHPIGSAPLAQLVKPGQKVVIVHTDLTRATPNDRILPVVLAELEGAGVARADITLLNALGTHRQQTTAETIALLGEPVVRAYRCLQHDATNDANLVPFGRTNRGHPVRLNRTYLEADVRILTGFIEPHFFAGFSGGPKLVLPGIAGAESVLTNHGATMIGHPQATWGVTQGNPLWEEACAVALRTKPAFILNVALNTERQITGVFAGDLLAAHTQGCAFVKQHSMCPVDAPCDIVVTTNSGYPLDQNLYQCVKGMSAAARIVRPGGAIVLAAACADGLPDHGRYAALLAAGGTPQGVLDLIQQPGFGEQDQWQAQIQALIQLKADVHLYSDGLSDQQIRRALLQPCRNIEQIIAQLRAKSGPAARVCVLPDGPLTIASLATG